MRRPWWAFDSVRAQLGALVVALLLPLGGLVCYQFYDAARAQRAAAVARLHEFSEVVRMEALGLYREADWVLARLASANAADPEARLCAEHEPLRAFRREFLNLLVLNAHGNLVCSALPLRDHAFRPDPQIVAAAFKAEGAYAGRVMASAVTPDLVIAIVRALRDPAGRPLGQVSLTVTLAHFQQRLEELGIPPGFAVGIVDQEGTYIARVPDPAAYRGKSAKGVPAVEAALSGATGEVQTVDPAGIDRVYVFKRVPGAGWHVLAGVDASVLLAPQRRMTAQAFSAALIALALTGWIVLRANRRISRPLEQLASVAKATGQGQRGARARVEGLREVRDVAAEINRMLDSVAANDNALRMAADGLEELSSRLILVTEEERGEIARELHDELGQLLTALQYELKALNRGSTAERPALTRCLAIVDKLLDHVRDLSLDLRPAQLDTLGLVAALRSHIARHLGHSGLAITYAADQEIDRVRPEVATAIYRVAQEALTNVLRHARARHVWVELRVEDGAAVLRVRDDGAGFDEAALTHTTSGLRGMRDRARLVGGTLELSTAPGNGAQIELRAPLDGKASLAKP